MRERKLKTATIPRRVRVDAGSSGICDFDFGKLFRLNTISGNLTSKRSHESRKIWAFQRQNGEKHE